MQQVERALFRKRREQCLAHAVLPSAHRRRQLVLECHEVGLALLRGRSAHRDREARERGLRNHDLALDRAAVKAREQHVLDRAPRARVVLIARQIDEARVVAAERLAPAEHLELVPLLEREDAEADRAQLVERRLEQIVARQRVEDVLQGLAAMAARVETRLAHDLRDLHSQQRDRARALVVRARSEQAEEPPLDPRSPLASNTLTPM